jgi:hypothetical protein
VPRTSVLAFGVAMVAGLLAASLAAVSAHISGARYVVSAVLVTALVFGLHLVNRLVLPSLDGPARIGATLVGRSLVVGAVWWVLNPGTSVPLAALVGFGVALAVASLEWSRTIQRPPR